jgi:hypothetical protein
MTGKKLIYIAGPMRGVPWFNFLAFNRAKEVLQEQGWEVISPADMDIEEGFNPFTLPPGWDWNVVPDDFSFDDAVQRDLDAIAQCDAIYMLDGWEKSKGAKAELAVAQWRGLEVLYQSNGGKPKDGDTITNAKGGKQSYVSAAFHRLPRFAMRLVAQCAEFGAAKYGIDNWRLIKGEEHINHAWNHMNEFMLGDRSEDHLVHAALRLFFAIELAVECEEQSEHYRRQEDRTT